MQSEQLIQRLIEQTRQILNASEKLRTFNIQQLTWKEDPNSWNILECIEHLNLYGEFYLPTIEKAIQTTNHIAVPTFKSGFLGNYFAQSMLPKDKLNKMKTFKDKNPVNKELGISVIDVFVNQQLKTLQLLNDARRVNLNKVKVSTSLSTLLKLKLGDTFQFVIHHNLRHFKQIERLQKSLPTTNKVAL